MDLGLPDVDGQTLLGMLRRNYGLTELPIVVCTAWPPDAAQKMAEAYGFNDYISKPYKVIDFMNVVNKFIAD
jgi:CheY-like chemotaxis protein